MSEPNQYGILPFYEADSPVIRIKIAWDGKWSEGAREMRRHLAIEVLSEAA